MVMRSTNKPMQENKRKKRGDLQIRRDYRNQRLVFIRRNTTPRPEALFPQASTREPLGPFPKSSDAIPSFLFPLQTQTLAPPFSLRGPHHPHFLLLIVDEDDYPWRQNKDSILEWLHKSITRKSILAQCITTAMVAPRTWFGGIFGVKRSASNKYADYKYSPVQETRYQKLRERTNVPFDETRIEHQKALVELWNLAYPNVTLTGLISEQWKEMGWQGENPSTDFSDEMSVYNLADELYFAVKPRCVHCVNFVKILGEDEEAFDVLYCIAFAMMDAQWLAMHASYMEFNEVLQITRTQLERELALDDIRRIRDLPAFNLLHH
ncbi:hypothetical protein L2E82_42556 [Cichorium intybus]|uniref:Uncharacterized protein n=1 Tax=Cichorium intybus TaxID=13427 RepID=A0ACB8ZRK8_CICIN|nr:hypothetical protein L2E82_42556 [Cichorium intybus]